MISTTGFNLFHHRWALPILAQLYKDHGSKYATLLNHLGLSRSMLSSTIKVLIENDLVMKNPGHGHPMRPEYIMTQRGKKIGPYCHRLYSYCVENNLSELMKFKWAIPILNEILSGHFRFNEIKSGLSEITNRSLSLDLKLLTEKKLIARSLTEGFPPATIYSSTKKGKSLGKVSSIGNF